MISTVDEYGQRNFIAPVNLEDRAVMEECAYIVQIVRERNQRRIGLDYLFTSAKFSDDGRSGELTMDHVVVTAVDSHLSDFNRSSKRQDRSR